MTHEQSLQARAQSARYAKGRHFGGELGGRRGLLQPLQSGDHLGPSGQFRTARIGAKLAIATERHHDQGSQKTEQHFGYHAGDPITDAGSAVFLIIGLQGAIHDKSNHPRQKNYERVDHALQ